MLAAATGPFALVVPARDTVLATSLVGAFDSASRRRGLLGRDRLAPGEALAIAPSNAIHTFGMRFPIDLVFVRRDGRIVKVREAVAPNRLAAAWRGFAVIEMPAGTVARAGVRTGDRVEVRTAVQSPPATPSPGSRETD